MTHDHAAYYAQCGKNYKILLLVMLTRIFTRKSNAPLDKFPNFHCKEKNSSQMPGNAWGWGWGWAILELTGTLPTPSQAFLVLRDSDLIWYTVY